MQLAVAPVLLFSSIGRMLSVLPTGGGAGTPVASGPPHPRRREPGPCWYAFGQGRRALGGLPRPPWAPGL